MYAVRDKWTVFRYVAAVHSAITKKTISNSAHTSQLGASGVARNDKQMPVYRSVYNIYGV